MVRIEKTQADGLFFFREMLQARAAPHKTGVRLILENRRDEAVCVESLSPVVVGGLSGSAGTLVLGSAAVRHWVYIRQPRHKNDMPAAIVLGSTGPEIMDAVRGTSETGGIPQDPAGGDTPPTRFVSSEATCLCHREAGIIFGFFPLAEQLTQSILELGEDRNTIVGLKFDCMCDGQILEPGQELTGQWLLIDGNPDVLAALQEYADIVRESVIGFAGRGEPQKRSSGSHSIGSEADPTKLTHPPTVWCSWYYYGDGFNQEECRENIRFLKNRDLPIDVFLIDECWDENWGDWNPNCRWPDLGKIALDIERAGCRPGIWTCPLLAAPRSTTRYYHRDWLLKDRKGEPVRFWMNDASNYVLDPTHPEVLQFIDALYAKLSRRWGFTYHKLDFTRAVGAQDAVFYDRRMNRAQAYRQVIAAVREAIGPEAYLNVCGGFYGPLVGIVDAQRTGSDVKSLWPAPPVGGEDDPYGPFTIKQNTLRFWMNRLWENDPDALTVRKRSKPYRGEPLSLGLLNDTEALTCTLNQYLGGGIVCFTENLTEVDEDRLMLLRHCSPSTGSAAIPLDVPRGVRFPSLFRTEFDRSAAGLTAWCTLSVINWSSGESQFQIILDRGTLGPIYGFGDRFIAAVFSCSDSAAGSEYRLVDKDGILNIGPIPPHGCEVVKIQPLVARRPHLVSTDGHFSMGAAEIVSWRETDERLSMSVLWEWDRPLELRVMAPEGRTWREAPSCRLAAPNMGVVSVSPVRRKVQEIKLEYARLY